MSGKKIRLRGKFHVEHYRNKTKIGVYDFYNDIVNEGLDKVLNVMFHDATKITPWYLSLIDNAGGPVLDPTDTMGGHGGWVEATQYDETDRVTWDEDAASGQSITNSVPATFTISATKTIYGLFVTSSNAKSGTTGTLWSAAAFAAPIAVADDDELKVTYTVAASNA